MNDPGQRNAYVDESFRGSDDGGIYVLAAAVIDDAHDDVRAVMCALRRRRRTGMSHWTEMDRKQRRHALSVVAGIDGLHVVTVGAPVPCRRQERARARCLAALVLESHGYGVTVMTMEARTRTLDRRDTEAVTGVRRSLPRDTQFRIEHTRGADEPLLWIADTVAGTVRAHHEGSSTDRHILNARLYELKVATGL